MNAKPSSFLLLAGVLLLGACGSDGDDDGSGDGSGGTGGSGGGSGGMGESGGGSLDRCALDITISGDANLDLDFDDMYTCATAYTAAPGARVAFGPTPVGDIGAVELVFPELAPEQTVAGIALPMTIHHADRTQFSPTGCVADITDNAFSEATDAGDVYRVAGDGTCAGPGVNGDRSVSVVGTFRFAAPIRWQN